MSGESITSGPPRKTPIQRIRGELLRFNSRLPNLFGAPRTMRKWKRICSRLLNSPVRGFDGTLYVLGDSHTNFFGGTEYIRFIKVFEGVNTSPNFIPFITTYHVGPATAFNLPNKESQVQVWQKTEEIIRRGLIPPGSPILLCFGEIDCRVHLIKQAEKRGKKPEETALAIVDNYMVYADWLRGQGFHVACWGTIGTRKGGPDERGDFPVHGTEVERNRASRIFNSILEEACRARNMRFCSIFDALVDENLETREKYISADRCHLSQRAAPLLAEALLDAGLLERQGSRLTVATS